MNVNLTVFRFFLLVCIAHFLISLPLSVSDVIVQQKRRNIFISGFETSYSKTSGKF